MVRLENLVNQDALHQIHAQLNSGFLFNAYCANSDLWEALALKTAESGVTRMNKLFEILPLDVWQYCPVCRAQMHTLSSCGHSGCCTCGYTKSSCGNCYSANQRPSREDIRCPYPRCAELNRELIYNPDCRHHYCKQCRIVGGCSHCREAAARAT